MEKLETLKELKDILDIIFVQKEEYDLFDFTPVGADKLAIELNNKEAEFTKFINSRVHPKSANKLKELKKDYTNAIYNLSRLEKKSCYKTGFFDGVKLMLMAFSSK